jgi:hypothetical protein
MSVLLAMVMTTATPEVFSASGRYLEAASSMPGRNRAAGRAQRVIEGRRVAVARQCRLRTAQRGDTYPATNYKQSLAGRRSVTSDTRG